MYPRCYLLTPTRTNVRPLFLRVAPHPNTACHPPVLAGYKNVTRNF